MRKASITRLLLVEDNPGDARLLREMLNEQESNNTVVTHVGRMSEAEKHLAEHAVDIILLDLGLPDAQGLEAVRRARAAAPRVPLVVLTGLDDESLATQALQEGAQDYLIKGQIETRGLLRALRYAIERKAMEEALFEEKERAQVTLNSIGDAVACTDISGNITFLNLVAEKIDGLAAGRKRSGRPMAEVLRILDTSNREIRPGSDGDGSRAQPDGASAVELRSSSDATDMRSRSRTPSPRSTTAKGRRPARSSSSATSAWPGRWRCR